MNLSFDVCTFSAVIAELRKTIVPGTITDVGLVDERTCCFDIASGGNQNRLLVSIDPAHFRLFLTAPLEITPGADVPFLATLRAHCRNAALVSVSQQEADRVAVLDLNRRGSLLSSSLRLVLELTGRMSNLIIVRPEDGVILDCWRRIDINHCRYRQLSPGLPYVPPPPPRGLNPCTDSYGLFQQALLDLGDEPVVRGLAKAVRGAGRILAAEFLFRAGLKTQTPCSSLDDRQRQSLWSHVVAFFEEWERQQYTPTLFTDDRGAPVVCSPFDLQQYFHLQKTHCDSISKALQVCYDSAMQEDSIRQLRQDMVSALDRELLYWRETASRLGQELDVAMQHEAMTRKGEIILANIDRLHKGMDQAQVMDYFAPGEPLTTVDLDPSRTPRENAVLCFRKARKARQAMTVIGERLRRAQERLKHLGEARARVDNADDRVSLLALRQELFDTGVLSVSHASGPSGTQKKRSFRMYVTSTGWTVLAGRDGRDNDRLTFGEAAPDDLWFHARGVSGSHVVLRRENKKQNVDKATLHEVAALAAFLSKARGSKMVSVSYTEKRYVRRSRGAPPGTVVVEREKTLMVTPRALPSYPGADKRSQS